MGRFVNRYVGFSIYMMADGSRDYFYRDNLVVKPVGEFTREADHNAPPSSFAAIASHRENGGGDPVVAISY